MGTSVAAGPLHVILPPRDEFLLVLDLHVDSFFEFFPALQCRRCCDDFAQCILRRLHHPRVGANHRSPRQCNVGFHAAIRCWCFHWRNTPAAGSGHWLSLISLAVPSMARWNATGSIGRLVSGSSWVISW